MEMSKVISPKTPKFADIYPVLLVNSSPLIGCSITKGILADIQESRALITLTSVVGTRLPL